MNLHELKNGETGEINGIEAGCELYRRLEDMGLIVGKKVTIIRSAPFKGPILIEIMDSGQRLMLGRNICKKILIQKQ